MTHPFQKLAPRVQRNAYWAALALTAVIGAVLQAQANPYCASKPGEPVRYNIIDFEFARTPELAQAIVDSWGPEGRAGLTGQTLTDYLFLLTYPQAIALGILAVLTNARSRRWIAFGVGLAWAQWLAGGLDAVENGALLVILKGQAYSPLPEIAYYCASVKFAIVGAGILFVLAGVALGYTRPSPSTGA